MNDNLITCLCGQEGHNQFREDDVYNVFRKAGLLAAEGLQRMGGG